MLWDLALFFAALGFAAIGIVNPRTVPIWFGLTLMLLGIVALKQLRSRRNRHAAAPTAGQSNRETVRLLIEEGNDRLADNGDLSPGVTGAQTRSAALRLWLDRWEGEVAAALVSDQATLRAFSRPVDTSQMHYIVSPVYVLRVKLERLRPYLDNAEGVDAAHHPVTRLGRAGRSEPDGSLDPAMSTPNPDVGLPDRVDAHVSIATGTNLAHSVAAPASIEPHDTAWLLIPEDLSSINLTTTDLDLSLAQTKDEATRLLAPDAQVEFKDLSLAPRTVLRLRAWSRRAGRYADFTISPSGTTHTELRDGSGTWGTSGERDGKDIPIWRFAQAPPWHHDPSWLSLIEQVGYRTRPLRAASTVLEWSFERWRLVVVVADEDGDATETTFEIEGDELRVRRLDRIPGRRPSRGAKAADT